MSFSGDLQGLSLADVFQNVAGNRSTGWMKIGWRQRSCFVRFHDGVVTGFSFGENEHLVSADFLLQRGYLDDETAARLKTKLRRSKKTPCQIAVAAKVLDPDTALHAVFTRIEEQVYDLMLLREAEFSFTEGESPPGLFDADQDPARIGLEVGPLVMEGARRRDEWQQIHRLVGTDRDLVVLLEGWEAFELDELENALTQYLDGLTDVRSIMPYVTASRFDVMRALANLVQMGAARLATPEEMEAAADDARAAGDLEEAVRLLQQASSVQRSDKSIKQKLVDVLVELERPKDAAADLAAIAHQTAADGDIHTAADLYARAYELDPDDLPLLEHRVELLKLTNEDEPYVAALEGLVEAYLAIGVAERARSALRLALERKSLRNDARILDRLARVESSLGHWEESARLFRVLAEQFLAKDEPRALEHLRSALEQTPDDESLAARIRDIENGQARRRRAIRSYAVRLTVAGITLFCIGLAGVAEFRATRRVMEAFDDSLAMLDGGDAVDSLVELDSVRSDLLWSPTRSRAIDLFDRLTDIQFAAVEERIQVGDYATARDTLTSMIERIDRADLRTTCEILLERVEVESKALGVLHRADREGDVAVADLEVLAGLTDPSYLNFHIAHVERVQNPDARLAVVLALQQIASPRAVPALARLYLTEQHDRIVRVLDEILAAGARLQRAERHADWSRLEARLRDAAQVPETRDAAQHLLELLFD